MKQLLFFIWGCLLSVSLGSINSHASSEKSLVKSTSISQKLDEVVREFEGNTNIGILVISAQDGRCVYKKNEEKLFVPASCMKIFTAAAALAYLGPSYQFSTALYTDSRYTESRIGHLFLKGSGNPEFKVSELDDLASELINKGIQHIDGDIIVDASDFDHELKGPGWMWDDEPKYWNVPISALLVNHGCMQVCILPSQDKQSVRAYGYPKNQFVQLENFVKISSNEIAKVHCNRTFEKNKNLLRIYGEVHASSEPITQMISVDQPHLFTGFVLKEILARKGVSCRGSVKQGKITKKAALLAEHKSNSLSSILKTMMKDSDNLYADCLFKKCGQSFSQSQGSWSSGSRAVRSFLSEKGINPSQMVLLDGSGISRYNLISAAQMVGLLAVMKKSPFSEHFVSSLSVSGVDGTLRESMKDKELKSRIKAKTGSMAGIKNICGYLQAKDGKEYIFCIIQNGFIEPRDEQKLLEKEFFKNLIHMLK
ncbi:MAG: D-alanyl-D-alanine carboxypeptidase/D-alanyl-D-alanine-endopeptidase [Chlamydiae bacterium]|nr:D-alanyl-D-alanine carboxypeptidase/D-alanyl-D-alanine-endopeptidase [Chlamydiota bacterium]